MAAFRRAVDEGFGYLELDVHATADGVAVVHHDRTLDRTTDATGPLAARTAAELDRVRVRGAHRREPIPHLHDVLAALPDTRVTVELKSGAAVRPVLDVLAELDAWDRVCLAGYHDPWLRVARRLARAQGAPLFTSMGHTSVVGLRVRGWTRRETGPAGPAAAPTAGAAGRLAGARRPGPAPPPVRRRHGRRRRRAAGRPRERPRGARVDRRRPGRDGGAARPGADGILTDRPDLLRDLLRARGTWTRVRP